MLFAPALLMTLAAPVLGEPVPGAAAAAAVAAEDATPARPINGNARSAVSDLGADAMARLTVAVAARKGTGSALAPVVTPGASETSRDRLKRMVDAVADSPDMRIRARSAYASGQAGLAGQRNVMAKRVAQALGLEEPELAALSGAVPAAILQTKRPLLFVSSSMPLDELRTYAAQLEKAGGVMAFRGMPGGLGRVAPMAKLSAQILRFDPGCDGPACQMRTTQIIVDPIAFRTAAVTRVPAFTMVPGDPTQAYCERAPDAPGPAHVVFGDAALSGLLEEYARLGGGLEVRDAQARLGAR